MPVETTEAVAEHSTRLQPSVNLHAPVTVFMFSCSGTNLLPRRPDGTRIYNRSSSTVYMCIVVQSSKQCWSTSHDKLQYNWRWQLPLFKALSKHSVNAGLQVLGEGETHIWWGKFDAFLMFLCFGCFSGVGNLGFWGEVKSPQEIAGINIARNTLSSFDHS